MTKYGPCSKRVILNLAPFDHFLIVFNGPKRHSCPRWHIYQNGNESLLWILFFCFSGKWSKNDLFFRGWKRGFGKLYGTVKFLVAQKGDVKKDVGARPCLFWVTIRATITIRRAKMHAIAATIFEITTLQKLKDLPLRVIRECFFPYLQL